MEWKILTENLIRLIPWLILHSIGTQFFRSYHKEKIPLFHSVLPTLYLLKVLGIKPVILLLAQPLAMFTIAELIPHTFSGKENVMHPCGYN